MNDIALAFVAPVAIVAIGVTAIAGVMFLLPTNDAGREDEEEGMYPIDDGAEQPKQERKSHSLPPPAYHDFLNRRANHPIRITELYRWTKKDATIAALTAERDRLREALIGVLQVADGVPMTGIEAESRVNAARAALQQQTEGDE